MRIAVVIPAWNEEASIGGVVRAFLEAAEALPAPVGPALLTVWVADNGSTDRTAAEARAAGATVIPAPRRGYGSACLAAIRALPATTDWVVFADGDAADDPADLYMLLEPLARGEADLCIGSRSLGERLGLVERGALTLPQQAGNRLATGLLRCMFGVHFSDLGPFRAIHHAALRRLQMDDPDFGWTVQMQARAAAMGLRSVEVPVHYRKRRTGVSKVSGDLRGALSAGRVILTTLAAEGIRALRQPAPPP